MSIFDEYLITFGWAITGAISMAVCLPILLRVFSALTPINEWEEIKKGNIGVAIILATVVLATAIVVSVTIF